MKKAALVMSFLLIFLLVAVPAGLANHKKGQEPQVQNLHPESPPINQIIIKFNDAVNNNSILESTQKGADLQTLSQVGEITLQYGRPMSNGAHVLQLPEMLPVADVATIAKRLARLEDVEYAEPDYIRQIIGRPTKVLFNPANTVPNDPRFSDQWHYNYVAGSSEGVNLKKAWDINKGSASTIVAVIDTGILNHSDLSGRTVQGYDFISNATKANDGDGRDSDPTDPGDWVTANECGYTHSSRNSSWHGTHVAGTIGATTNNNSGVAGVNWNAKILPIRVLGKCGGSISDIVDGMLWAAGLPVSGVSETNTTPADVLNLSLGGFDPCSITEQNAIDQIVGAGTTVVISAGNSNADAKDYSPGNCNNVITVAANDRSGDKANYSNFGNVVEITAPGGETSTSKNGVLSTLDGGLTTPNNDNAYAYYQGTSMAAPHVSGVVSLVIAEHPGLTPAGILNHIQVTARAFPSGSSCTTSICGPGIIDAFNALSTSPVQLNNFIYLPLMLNNYSSNINNPFANPDFESGRTGWTESSSNGWTLILSSSNLLVSPRSGNWAAWLGGDNNETSYIQQTVTVPAATPYLTYWHYIASNDICGFDFAKVIINGNQVVDVYNLCSSTSTGSWVKHSVNLSSYAGQSISIRIQAETDGSIDSSLYVDDVSFQSTANNVQAPFTPQPNSAADFSKASMP